MTVAFDRDMHRRGTGFLRQRMRPCHNLHVVCQPEARRSELMKLSRGRVEFVPGVLRADEECSTRRDLAELFEAEVPDRVGTRPPGLQTDESCVRLSVERDEQR